MQWDNGIEGMLHRKKIAIDYRDWCRRLDATMPKHVQEQFLYEYVTGFTKKFEPENDNGKDKD